MRVVEFRAMLRKSDSKRALKLSPTRVEGLEKERGQLSQ